jgi:hypothetical protein
MNKLFKILSLLAVAMTANTAWSNEWNFDVYLDDSKMGQHSFVLNSAAELTSTANFKVKILFFNAYQYEHSAVETWQGDCLSSLSAHTVEDKVTTAVKAKLSAQTLRVEDGKSKQNLPACSMTFAYWNPKIVEQSKLLNPQNAEYLDTKFTKLGSEQIEVKGQKITATHYQLNGSLAGKPKLNIELWYNAANEWVALQSTTPEGYKIRYKLR